MDNTSGTQVPADESTNHGQNQGANNVPLQIDTINTSSGTNVIVGGAASGSRAGASAEVGAGAGAGNDVIEIVRVGSDGVPIELVPEPFRWSPFGATFVNVEPNEDILEILSELAEEREIFILMGMGNLSYIELCNRKDAPVANTVLQGLFSINSLDGSMVIPKENEAYRASRIQVVVNSEDGRVRGGPVRKLISKSHVHVMVSTLGRDHLADLAKNAHTAWSNGEGPYFPNVDNMFNRDYINTIYEDTLNELNEKNSFAWRHSPASISTNSH